MTIALYATIWLALTLFVLAEAGRGRVAHHRPPARWAWPALMLGAALLIAHVLIALSVRYGWNHERAVAETAKQAAAVYGFEWRGNIFVSYAFVLLWLAEGVRWRGSPSRAVPGPPAAAWAWRGFFLLIIFNAAVVFATSLASRLLGTVLITALLWAWWPKPALDISSKQPQRI